MQGIPRTVRGSCKLDATIYQPERPEAVASLGIASASRVGTLARASVQSLPRLDLVSAAYSQEVHAELLYDLCAALVECGIATPAHWTEADGSGNRFVQIALHAAITEERVKLLERNIDYHLQIADVIEAYGYDRALESSDLAILISSGNCGYLEIGDAIEALETEALGLGAAFYWQLLYSLYRILRVYDHDDAFRHEEYLRESADMEDEEAREQYEFPEVEKSLPEPIRTTFKDHTKHSGVHQRRLLRRHQDGRFGGWVTHLLNIHRLSRLYPKTGRDLGDGYYDSPPLPSLLIVFKQHDAIMACFDEESQYMLEGSPEPQVSFVFSPKNPKEVGMARKVVERFILLNCELFQLVEEIAEWRKQDERRHVNRGELSLRAS